jgi:hypothetical protein
MRVLDVTSQDFSTMSSTAYKSQAPPAISTRGKMDADYDYGAQLSPEEKAFQEYQLVAPPPPPPPPTDGDEELLDAENEDEDYNATGEDALLDLAQLEELHQEAERMKALGNKHMAAQVS